MATASTPATSPGPAGLSAGRPQPQTTLEPAGGPFIRHSQPGRRPMYQVSGQAYGGVITQPLVSVPGYYSGYRLNFAVTGGTGAAATYNADAPYNLVSLVTLKDAFGTPLIVCPGYEAFNLIPRYGGLFGWGATRDITQLPSWVPPTPDGNFAFNTQLPLEFSKGYGLISGANASLLPTLQFNLAPSTTVYSNAPGGTPVIAVTNDSDFYWLPEGVSAAPPGLGSTIQWVFQQCNPPIASGATSSVQLPRLGGYLSVIILELRDALGNRIDAWPSRLRIYVDGVPLIDSRIDSVFDDMATAFQGVSRPTGVIAIDRKTSLAQTDFGLLDTGETYLSTNPGTLIEIQGAPWGTIANGPATLNCLLGQVVPAGTLIQGLPEM